MSTLTSAQRKYLMRLAHDLKPVVFIGKQGLTPNVTRSIGEAFNTTELIKVKFVDLQDQKQALATELASSSGSAVAGIIGNIAVLYRPSDDPERREIVLP